MPMGPETTVPMTHPANRMHSAHRFAVVKIDAAVSSAAPGQVLTRVGNRPGHTLRRRDNRGLGFLDRRH